MIERQYSVIGSMGRFAATAMFAAVMALGFSACDRDEGLLEETAEGVEETTHEVEDAAEGAQQ